MKLSFFFLFAIFFHVVGARASTTLEVVSVFFNNDRSVEFHRDVDSNVLELARNNLSHNLNITLLRELPNHEYVYQPQNSGRGVLANELFSETYFDSSFKVPGNYKKLNLGSIQKTDELSKLLVSSFKQNNSIKILFLYGHGLGPTGFKDIDLFWLKEELATYVKKSGTKLDLVVYDSCFLGNIEFLFEMRNISHFSMASEESEFAQGQPFEILDSLQENLKQDDVHSTKTKKMAAEILQKFLSSYSTINESKNGKHVESSSAVFALYDNKNWESLINGFKNLKKELNNLTQTSKVKLDSKFKRISMDNSNLLDVGQFLKIIISDSASPQLGQIAEGLLQKLDITTDDFQAISPMIQLRSPKSGSAILALSVNNHDRSALERLLPNLKNQINSKFLKPSEVGIKVNQLVRLQPFLPHVKSIEVRFFDPNSGESYSQPVTYVRTKDLKIHENKISSPILLFGVTESKKTMEKRYSGLNITHPFRPMPNIDYMNLEFQKKIHWLQ